MKRFITIVAIIFSSAQIFASDLIIRGEVDIPFSVYVNGQKYYSYYNQVTIPNIPQGYYSVQIYAEGASNELMYDCRIDVPRRTTVTATFTGGNQIYVTSTRYANPVIIDVTPYPHRYGPSHDMHHEPAPHVHQSVPQRPKPAHHQNNGSARPAQNETSRSTPSTRSSETRSSSSSNSSSRSSATESSSSVNTSKSSSPSTSKASSSTSRGNSSSSRSTPSSRK